MSSPFEPFTPANNGRRAQEWNWQEEQYQVQDPWSQQQQQYQQEQYQQQYQQYQQDQYQQEQYQQRWQQPAYEQSPYQQQYQPAPSSQPAYTPAPAPRQRRSKYKPIIFGLVTALVLVSGWQAFRVERMIQSSNDLAEAVSSSQGRTEELERKLTSVFDSEGIAEGVLPSVFRVRAGEFTGTAFAVGQADGRTSLFTNYHVVEATFEGGERQVALERGNNRINATIVKVDAGKDLALLRANREIAPLAVAAGDVKPGQQVMAVGAPLGLEDSVSTGVISAFRDTQDGPTIQFDAPINPGNSGGPVVNASKQVVGIATAKARDAEGIGLAIPIEVACKTLGACGNG